MPNCFCLYRSTDIGPDRKPVPFATIDRELCDYLGVPEDKDRYVYGWYDAIGLMLAFGASWERIIDTYADCDEPMVLAIYWLALNFTPDAWAEVGRG